MNPAELQAKVRQIEIRTRRLVSDAMVGQYQSVFKGQGMDFDEVREYQPGDEVRTGDPLFTLGAEDAARFDRALEALDGAYRIGDPGDEILTGGPLIADRIA